MTKNTKNGIKKVYNYLTSKCIPCYITDEGDLWVRCYNKFGFHTDHVCTICGDLIINPNSGEGMKTVKLNKVTDNDLETLLKDIKG